MSGPHVRSACLSIRTKMIGADKPLALRDANPAVTLRDVG